MAAVYRAVKPGEKAEEWEGIRFVSAVVEGAELEAMLKAGWVDHPLKVKSDAVDKKTANRIRV